MLAPPGLPYLPRDRDSSPKQRNQGQYRDAKENAHEST
jgi:hypothetical protein